MSELERKVGELCRLVLGTDAVTYFDDIARLDAVIDGVSSGAVSTDDEDESLGQIRSLMEDAESDLSYIRMRLDDMERKRKKVAA
jgi:hypothetical protein